MKLLEHDQALLNLMDAMYSLGHGRGLEEGLAQKNEGAAFEHGVRFAVEQIRRWGDASDENEPTAEFLVDFIRWQKATRKMR